MLPSMRFHHHAFAVANLDAAVAWYRENLGFGIEQRFVLAEAHLEIAKLLSPEGVRIELLASLREGSYPDVRTDLVAPGKQHLCFEVDDIEHLAAVLRARGVRLTQEPRVIVESNEKNCWIADGEGNLIEFIETLRVEGEHVSGP